MSTFVFAKFDISDQAGYDRYVALATPIFFREKVRIHASDNSPHALTPNMKADKVVLLEFQDHDHYLRFFSLEDYVAAAKIRDASATLSATVFERFELPK